jgi:hypothetical protein
MISAKATVLVMFMPLIASSGGNEWLTGIHTYHTSDGSWRSAFWAVVAGDEKKLFSEALP